MNEGDPLADLVTRSLGVRATDVRAEPVAGRPDLERIRFVAEDRASSLLLRRLDRERPLEAQLLPFLARRTAHVPLVRSRGLPPPAARARAWILVEDVIDAPSACDDLEAVLAAKRAIEAAVARDGPALRALGVAERASGDPLASWPRVLVHGALTCAATHRTERGIVLSGWDRAHIGCGLVDVVTLARDSDSDAAALARAYVGREVDAAELTAARLLAGAPAPYT